MANHMLIQKTANFGDEMGHSICDSHHVLGLWPEKGDACRCHIAFTAAADLLDPDMFMSGTSGFRCWGKMGRAGCCWMGWGWCWKILRGRGVLNYSELLKKECLKHIF